MPVAALPAFWGAVSAGAGAGATVYGAKKMSSANSSASKIQEDYNNRALAAAQEEQTYNRNRDAEQLTYDRSQRDLDVSRGLERQGYQRQQFGNYLTRLKPYEALGSSAVPRVNAALERPYADSGGGPMVMLKAPNGETQSVPASQVDHYLKLGATQVNG